jgi:hypothetical protein
VPAGEAARKGSGSDEPEPDAVERRP